MLDSTKKKHLPRELKCNISLLKQTPTFTDENMSEVKIIGF